MRDVIRPNGLEHARKGRVVIQIGVVKADAVFTIDAVSQMIEVIHRLLPSHHADNIERRVLE